MSISHLILAFARLATLSLAIGASIATASGESDAPVEYWTIEANEGQSAGGHAAIRIGETVYHVEHRGDGLIIDRRDDRQDFERAYRSKGNRSIGVLSLDLPRSVEKELESFLRRRFFERQQRTERLAELEEDVRWLDGVLEKGRFEVAVPGLGLFAANSTGCAAPEASSRAARKIRIIEGHGVGWLDRRLVTARRRLHRALREASGRPQRERIDGHVEMEPAAGGLRNVAEAAQVAAAIEAIRDCRGPAPDRLVAISTVQEFTDVRSGGVAEEPDRRRLGSVESSGFWEGVGRELESDLSRLLESHREDVGLAIALAWARLAAVDRTLSTGRPTLLDPFAESAFAEHESGWRVPVGLSATHEANARRELEVRLARLASETDDLLEARLFRAETALHAFEHARADELHRGPDRESILRMTRSNRHPDATVFLPWPDGSTLRDIEDHRNELARLAREERRRLEAELGYGLIDRNCVTELFAALDEALLVDSETESFALRRRRDPEAPLSFIPVVAARIARRQLPSSESLRLPSWRETRLTRLREDGEGSFVVGLRESNTLSARTYWSTPEDSIFLFFSNAPVWSRPLAGLANLATGMGATFVGVLRAPFDRGQLFRRGLQGIVMSVPEVFFFSIRKGSYPVVPEPSYETGVTVAYEMGGK